MKGKIAKFMCVAVVMVAAFVVSTANAAEGQMPCKLGLGYQGIMAGELINGASLRMLPAPLGAQLVVGYWEGDIDNAIDVDGDLYTVRGKVLYSLVNKELVKFYLGAELGYSEADVDGDDADAWSYGPLMGAEWQFEEIPEIGFNFEVGYQFNDIEIDDTDIDLDGVNVTFGIHYYF